ncbi:MAG TPA: uroporphyrinogen-III synthase [Steroidobacteraceae bacterium]|jgi:uroporphyrinogen-III synthase|nr:uroporphyrinogen-III synthase [Steroidobacteraceae bacterium]
MLTLPLAGRTIAVPESREIEVFASLLERRGARVIRCPLVAIRDAPDPGPVLEWSRRLAAGAFDDLILLTGEGLRRILACIERHEPALEPQFVAALRPVRKITRGPKPAKVLRELDMKPEIAAERPTTEGVIASLRNLDLSRRRVGVQLYGTEPNLPLLEFLESAGAVASTVAPYVYADAADEEAVRSLLDRLRDGGVDAIAFTSSAQIERLMAIGSEEGVRAALANTLVAAVGPVVAATLHRHGIEARLMPEESFFLKPLTSALEQALGVADGAAAAAAPPRG